MRVVFGRHAAIRDVDLDLHAGETLGLVGESGSGKSSLARAVLRLIPAAGGTVHWRGEDLSSATAARLRELRRDLQIVFQDPTASLNPRMTVGEAIAEPLIIFEPQLGTSARRSQVADMLERVGLHADMVGRYPHELSGGQCQRVAIARAMILKPKLLICDEPVSSLDVSIQGQIVNLLADLKSQFGTALLFISHNLAVVRHLSETIMVLYLGRCVELAARDVFFARPLHPYSQALLAAAARVAPASLSAVSQTPPETVGCPYRERCSFAIGICQTVDPPLSEVVPHRFAACHRAREFCEAAQVSSRADSAILRP
jgi:oligopeptide transport system ATP-binding protein